MADRVTPGYWCDMCGQSDVDGHATDCPWRLSSEAVPASQVDPRAVLLTDVATFRQVRPKGAIQDGHAAAVVNQGAEDAGCSG